MAFYEDHGHNYATSELWIGSVEVISCQGLEHDLKQGKQLQGTSVLPTTTSVTHCDAL